MKREAREFAEKQWPDLGVGGFADDLNRFARARFLEGVEWLARRAVQGEPTERIKQAIAFIRASWMGHGEPTRNTPAGEIIAILRGEGTFKEPQDEPSERPSFDVFGEPRNRAAQELQAQGDSSDDEREALIEQATWVLIEYDTDTADRGVSDEHYRERRADVERVFPLLFRRTVQGEPSDVAVKAAQQSLVQLDQDESGNAIYGYVPVTDRPNGSER